MAERGMADETLDGIMFGLRLASNPQIRARNAVFQHKLMKFRESTASLTKEQMIAQLKDKNPAYLLDSLRQKSIDEIRERYVWTFVHNYISLKPSLPTPPSDHGAAAPRDGGTESHGGTDHAA